MAFYRIWLFVAVLGACTPVANKNGNEASESKDDPTPDATGDGADDSDGVDSEDSVDGTDEDPADGTDDLDGDDGTDDQNSDDGTDTDSSLPNTVAITGTLALGAGIAGETDELTIGEPIEGALVFVKGFPDQTATTNSSGAFTLELAIDTEMTLVPANYSVVMWYTTNTNEIKFGTQQDITAEPNTTEALGSIELGYTKKAKLRPKDEADQVIGDYATNCDIVFPGYEGKISVEVVVGELHADYLPPADYTIDVDCAGYQPKTYTFSFPTAGLTGSGLWEFVDIPLVAE